MAMAMACGLVLLTGALLGAVEQSRKEEISAKEGFVLQGRTQAAVVLAAADLRQEVVAVENEAKETVEARVEGRPWLLLLLLV